MITKKYSPSEHGFTLVEQLRDDPRWADGEVGR